MHEALVVAERIQLGAQRLVLRLERTLARLEGGGTAAVGATEALRFLSLELELGILGGEGGTECVDSLTLLL